MEVYLDTDTQPVVSIAFLLLAPIWTIFIVNGRGWWRTWEGLRLCKFSPGWESCAVLLLSTWLLWAQRANVYQSALHQRCCLVENAVTSHPRALHVASFPMCHLRTMGLGSWWRPELFSFFKSMVQVWILLKPLGGAKAWFPYMTWEYLGRETGLETGVLVCVKVRMFNFPSTALHH